MKQFPISINQNCTGCKDPSVLDFQFDYAFQPIVQISTKKVFAHEALVRGPNGESAYSVLSQVNEANRYMFDQQCRKKAITQAAQLGIQENISINFMPNAVYNAEICIKSTLETARENNFPINRIIFELIEGEEIQDKSHIISIFKEYQRLGFKTAIDDFGAGYSGLNLLANFQPDIVKLDMELLHDIDTNKVKQMIVRHMTRLCEELNIMVIAEGIETIGERDFATDIGIDYIQGYYYSKPVFKGVGVITSW